MLIQNERSRSIYIYVNTLSLGDMLSSAGEYVTAIFPSTLNLLRDRLQDDQRWQRRKNSYHQTELEEGSPTANDDSFRSSCPV